jgi:hypothetical protein
MSLPGDTPVFLQSATQGLTANCLHIIFRMMLQILSSFSLYRDIATMYLEVDNYVIQPSLLLVDQLAIVNTDKALGNDTFFDQQRKKLSEFNINAEKQAHATVEAVSFHDL